MVVRSCMFLCLWNWLFASTYETSLSFSFEESYSENQIWLAKKTLTPATVPNKETNSCEPTSLFHVLGLLVSGILRSMQKPNSPTRHHPPLSRFRRLGWMLPIRLKGFDDRSIILVGDLFFKKYPSKCEKKKTHLLCWCSGQLAAGNPE